MPLMVFRSMVLFVLAGGVFVAGSLAWGMVADGYRPDRFDVIGALICLAGVGVIMYAPRG
jgi:small multidrug resistance family-3 protein